ncbi:MAG: YchJ family protein [Povalibacter sp.]
MTKSELCPCGTGKAYPACCGQWHAGKPAPSAEALMRSRYVAFVLKNEAYLLSTWDPSTRPAAVPFEPDLKWLGLKVVDARPLSTTRAEVEFIARFRVGGGSAARLHERSRFIREGDRWFYIDGELNGSK